MQRLSRIEPERRGTFADDYRATRKPLDWLTRLSPKTLITKAFARTGIRIDGERPWDLVVNDERFYWRVLREGPVGLGDSYMDGWWECKDLEGFFCRILKGGLGNYSRSFLNALRELLITGEVGSPEKRVARQCSDFGGALYLDMLDSRLVYTCARWRHAATLDEAQEEKLHTV